MALRFEGWGRWGYDVRDERHCQLRSLRCRCAGYLARYPMMCSEKGSLGTQQYHV